MKFIVGYNFNSIKDDYISIRDEKLFREVEKDVIRSNPNHLIVFEFNNFILGWAIWHESNANNHPTGEPRDNLDSKIIKNLAGENPDFIELHELWIKEQFRGKGYGRKFFEFFEKFVLNQNFDSIIYYADHPAAISLCRKFNYKEEFNNQLKWFTFFKKL